LQMQLYYFKICIVNIFYKKYIKILIYLTKYAKNVYKIDMRKEWI